LAEQVEAIHGVDGLLVVAAAHPAARGGARRVADELGVDAVPAVVGEALHEIYVVHLLHVGGGGADERRFLNDLDLLHLRGRHLHHQAHLGGRVDAHPDGVLDLGLQLGRLRLHLELAGLQRGEAEEPLVIGVERLRAADLRRRRNADLHPLERGSGLIEHIPQD
jgi:hypothetical protein